MTSFKIGDKVKVIGLTEDDRTGVIIAKGDMPDVTPGRVVPGSEPTVEFQICW